jgi:hypothetical protein
MIFLAASTNDIAKGWSPTHSEKVAKPDCARQVASDQSPDLQIVLAQWHCHLQPCSYAKDSTQRISPAIQVKLLVQTTASTFSAVRLKLYLQEMSNGAVHLSERP